MRKSDGSQLRITIEDKPNGSIESVQILHVSILEDLWHDYLHFKKQAKSNSLFRQKRYLRAAILVLVAYLEGVVNRWYNNWLVDQGESDREIERRIRMTKIYSKCKQLTDQAVLKDPSIKQPSLDKVKNLRNELAHLQVSRDFAIFDELTLAVLDDSEKKIVDWLDMVSKALGTERHPDTKESGERLAQISPDAAQEYSGDDI